MGPDGTETGHFVLLRTYMAPGPLHRRAPAPRWRRDALTTPPPTATPSGADHRGAPVDPRAQEAALARAPPPPPPVARTAPSRRPGRKFNVAAQCCAAAVSRPHARCHAGAEVPTEA
eukprot:2492237-Prorocentrum_lima.AAC.1